jgi:hypothetical protein
MFCLGRGWTPRDELYGIADQLIDPGSNYGCEGGGTFIMQVSRVEEG